MGMTLKQAIELALEGLPGNFEDLMDASDGRRTVVDHVLGWIKDYAVHRGLVLESKDVIGDVRDAITDLASKRRASRRD
jgi:hypothetical protein